jgi:general stress protein 26
MQPLNVSKVSPRKTMESQIAAGDKANVHGEHVIRLAKQLADGNRCGILATVDEDGIPQVRWMATLSLKDFPHLYALTSPTSRKIAHIHRNPRVSWMFTSEGNSMVVNMTGTASLITEKNEVNRIWRLIENKSNAFFLSLDTVSDGVAVIDTVIENIEATVPRYDLHYPPKRVDGSLLPITSDVSPQD